ncbi:CCX2, partial [Symbiodinium necroappetens]
MLLFKLPARFLVLVLAFDAALAVRPGIKVDGSRRLSRLLQKFLASEDRRSEFQDTLNTSTDDRWQREM